MWGFAPGDPGIAEIGQPPDWEDTEAMLGWSARYIDWQERRSAEIHGQVLILLQALAEFPEARKRCLELYSNKQAVRKLIDDTKSENV